MQDGVLRPKNWDRLEFSDGIGQEAEFRDDRSLQAARLEQLLSPVYPLGLTVYGIGACFMTC